MTIKLTLLLLLLLLCFIVFRRQLASRVAFCCDHLDAACWKPSLQRHCYCSQTVMRHVGVFIDLGSAAFMNIVTATHVLLYSCTAHHGYSHIVLVYNCTMPHAGFRIDLGSFATMNNVTACVSALISTLLLTM
jgi:hypothetical protein